MPKSSEVATELRKLADALDKEPDAELCRPMVTFYNDQKEEFLSTVRLFPRPLKKEVSEQQYEIANDYRKSAIWLRSLITRAKICTLVTPAKPAVYECEPLLSVEEESSLEISAR